MNQRELFDLVSFRTSRLTALKYSTSFSLGIRCLDKSYRDPIYAIYGFVRFADEIVDTLHDHPKKELLERFASDTWRALDEKISLNPILHSFQITVNQFGIERSLIEQFLHSMEMDLVKKKYDQEGFETYILGSAEVVGLMCLRVFVQGDEASYQRLKPFAMKLGSAFQKINFLRDLQADYAGLGRAYFPGLDLSQFDEKNKQAIEVSIAEDFHQGYLGIKQLPRKARLGVYIAYLYYLALFRKIRRLPSHAVLKSRIRIRNRYKLIILGYSLVKHQLNLI
ncbi:MAG TPA: phytoene/squalene synthase family protein [Cyclobacteriaceae bacterium]|nr:phytoene/squalene synthase family protein [Cyclobacteriaceae bacterium]